MSPKVPEALLSLVRGKPCRPGSGAARWGAAPRFSKGGALHHAAIGRRADLSPACPRPQRPFLRAPGAFRATYGPSDRPGSTISGLPGVRGGGNRGPRGRERRHRKGATGAPLSMPSVVPTITRPRTYGRPGHRRSWVGGVFTSLIDRVVCPWITAGRAPAGDEAKIAAIVIADGLCGVAANPIIRNAQEKRQLACVSDWLSARDYRQIPPGDPDDPASIPPGTFSFHMNVVGWMDDHGSKTVKDSCGHRYQGSESLAQRSSDVCRSEVGRGLHQREQAAQRRGIEGAAPAPPPWCRHSIRPVSRWVLRPRLLGLRRSRRNRLGVGASGRRLDAAPSTAFAPPCPVVARRPSL